MIDELVLAFVIGGGFGALVLIVLENLAVNRMSVEVAEKLLREARARAAAKAAYEKEIAP